MTACLQGWASRAEIDAFERHVDVCRECRRVLAALARASPKVPQSPETDFGQLGPGHRVGRYVLLGRRGVGGMGTVWAAHDPELDRRVALKLTHRGAASSSLPRLEARAMARLVHPNVVAVHDVGEHQGELYIAMDYVDGGTLREWLASPRSRPEILASFVAAGRGLAAAHRAGLVHGDFKPDNVLVATDGRVQVSDFGLARWLEAFDDVPAAAGTPGYISPEQRKGRPADPRSDQYSFCVALDEALRGHRPGQDRRRKALPKRLEHLLRQGLREDPDARHPNIDTLVDALEREPSRTWPVTGAFTLAAAAGVALLMASSDRADCEASALSLDGVWDGPAQDELQRRAARFAPDSLRVNESVDQWARRWRDASLEACLTRRSVSDATADARASCLIQQRAELAGLLGGLADAQLPAFVEARDVVQRLRRPSKCLDATTVAASPQEEELLRDLARVRGELLVPRAGIIVDRLAALRSRASTIGSPTAEAQAAIVSGLLARADGDFAQASANLSHAVEVSLEADLQDPLRESLIVLVTVDGIDRGRFGDGRRWAAWAEALLRRSPHDQELLALLAQSRAALEREAGDLESAETFARESVQLYTDLLGEDSVEAAASRSILAAVYTVRGDSDLAIATLEQVVDVYRQARGLSHPTTMLHVEKLAIARYRRGDLVAALGLEREVLASRTEVLGEDHPHVGTALTNLGMMLRSNGQLEEALDVQQQALAHAERVLDPAHYETGYRVMAVANALGGLNRHSEAEPLHRRAISILEAGLPPAHPGVSTARLNLALSWAALGRREEATRMFDRVLPALADSHGVGSPIYLEAKAEVAAALAPVSP